VSNIYPEFFEGGGLVNQASQPSSRRNKNMIDLKTKAYALAEATPRHLNQPTTPPIAWRQEGNELVVLLADGRKVRGPLSMYKPKPIPIPAKTVAKPLPSHSYEPLPSHPSKSSSLSRKKTK
jgi:hypothetical protein